MTTRTNVRTRPHAVPFEGTGIYALGAEELVLDDRPPTVGSAVCLRSGGRLTFRRVLEINGEELVVRCDVAPFEDRWTGEVVGCVRPRLIDRVAAVDPKHWTLANWHGAMAHAHLLATRRRFMRRARPNTAVFTTELLTEKSWPTVRSFWQVTCGRELPVKWQKNQHVIGLFDKKELVGVNIQLVAGSSSFSAFTLVDRRYRGIGGGYRMIKRALDIAEELRLQSMYVHINVRNLPSIAAYQGNGFVKKDWWSDERDPLASAERQWLVLERDLGN